MIRFEKWSVISTSAATAVTGIGYFALKYLAEPSEPWAVVNNPLQPWLLKAHILVAPLLVFAVGLITVRHIWQHLQRKIRLGRRSGLLGAIVFAPMVLSGYLIQSLTAEPWLQAVAWGHIGSSVLFSAGIAVHVMVAARRPGRNGGAGNGGGPFMDL